MAIYNLGQAGPRRESDMSGVSKALGESVELGMKYKAQQSDIAYKQGMLQNSQQATANAQSNALATQANAQENTAIKKQQAQVQLAKFEADEEAANRKNAMKVVEDYSMYMGNKDKAEQELFMQTDEYKEIEKLVKKHLHEYIGADGKVMRVPKEEIYETHLKGMYDSIGQKIYEGKELSPSEQQFKDFYQRTDIRIASEAIKNAEQDPKWYGASKEEKSQMVQWHLKELYKARGTTFNTRGDKDPLQLLDPVANTPSGNQGLNL